MNISRDLAQAIRDVLLENGNKPQLLAEVIDALRGTWMAQLRYSKPSRWRGFPPIYFFERDARAAGFCIRMRAHGSGNAIYIYTEPFDTVVDGRGRTQEVRE